ncbi:MAG: TonB-dependent receptor [Ekhidna sp.]|nr:TonB-dependent receptor [Ekhidna sp.]
MLSFNSAFSIPIGKRTSALIAFRQSFTDVINSSLYQDFLRSNRQNFLESVSPELNTIGLSPTLRFGDLNAKVQHRFTDKSVLDINFYGSQDFYRGDFVEDDDFEQFEVLDKSEWSNIGISANLKSQLKPNWFNNTTISASEYRENESLSITQTLFEDVEFLGDSIEANSAFSLVNYSIGSSVGDVTLKSHNEIDIDDQNMISAGVEINALNTTYNSTESLTFEQRLAGLDPEVIPGYADTLDLDATIVSFYGNYQFRKEEITTNLGIRSSYYEPTQKWYLEPRFDIGLRVNEQLALKGAASFHHQFISETSLSFLQNTDQFYWTLADDEAIPVQRSTHFIVGGTYNFGNWSLDLEYYNRRTGGILENQFLTLSPDVLDEIGFEDLNLGGENYAEGLDLFLKYKNRTFTSLLSYSLGRSENAFWYRNQNNPYPSAQDQRHELNFTNILKLGKVELASIFLLGTGQRYTPQNETINLVNETGSIYDLERINESKLPAYQRLDLSAKYSFKVGSFDFESGVTLFNVLNKINIKSRRYSLKFIFEESATNTSGRDEIEVIPLDTQLLGFTPNFFLNVRF